MAELIPMPKLGFDMQEGQLVRWLRKEGETVQKGDVLAEIETDKATVEVEAPVGGVVRRLLVEEGAVVPIGEPIAIVGTADEDVDALLPSRPAPTPESTPAPPPSPASPPSPARETVSQAAPPPPRGRVKASPLARRIARERGLDLTQLRGTGPGGRIVRRDVEAALAEGAIPAVSPPEALPVTEGDQVIPLSRLRQIIGRRMVAARRDVPHFYVTYEYRMDALLEARRRINASLEGTGEKLSVNDFLVKAVALTLREFPNLNASLDGENVVRHGEINIGNAVAVPEGLLTVVCRRADRKSLRQISHEVREMAARAREGKVRPEDIEGSTFSISNLGMFGVEHFVAIINPPEAAILAVGAARQVPLVEDGRVVVGWTMKATLSVDHRISDGAEAAQFMQALAKYIEDPVMLAV